MTPFEQGYVDTLIKLAVVEEESQQPSALKRGLGYGALGAAAGGAAGYGSGIKRLMRSPRGRSMFDMAVSGASNQSILSSANPRYLQAVNKMMKGRMGRGALIGGGALAALGAGSALLGRRKQEQPQE